MAKKLLFESVSCSRCGGSGSYSYCSMYGSVCFKCRGAGVVLTKRGARAQAFLNALRVRPAKELKVGDLIWEDSFYSKPKWARVLEIKPGASQLSKALINGEWVSQEHPILNIVSEGLSAHLSPESMVRVAFSKEEKEAHRAAALAYQAKLGKNGELLKKFKEAA